MLNKELNKSKVIINVIAIIIIIIIIAVLTIYMTNKKEAAYVSSDDSTVFANSTTNEIRTRITNSSENNAWVISNTQTKNENSVLTSEQAENEKSADTNTTTGSENSIASNTTTNNKTTTNTNTNSQSTNGVIWLTFDDGPSANITPKILDILKKEKIKATFFVINYSKSNEELLKREVEEGHTIGIHGYSHEYSKIYKSKDVFMDNIYSLQKRIQESTGVTSKYIRFPGGSSNTVSKKYCEGIMTELTKEVLDKGFKYYDWNISAEDAGSAKTSKDVYNNVIKNLSKKRGNMVLMHDFGANKKGLEALPDIIAYAKKNGYTFAPIDDNTPMYAQHVNN